MEQLPVQPRDWTVLQQDLVITVDDIVGRAVDKKMPGGNSMSDPKVMRIGHLVNLAGAPEIIGTKAAQTTGEGWANYIKKWYPGYVEPTVQINETGSELERSIIISRMTGGDRVEEFNVRVSNDYETGDEILVHLQPDTTNPNGNRSRPTLDEYVISEGAMGEVNGRIHPQVELDPNQTYRRSQKPTQFFDRKRNVFINRWQLHLVDEDSAEEAHKEWRERGGSVGKAVRYADDEDHWRVQPRDESGRWRDEVAALIDNSIKAHEGLAVDEPTPTKPAPRKSRGTRKVRGVRRAEDATPTLKAKPQAELKGQRGAQLQTQRGVRLGEREMSALKAGLAKPPKNPLLPPLDDRERYQVFTMSKFLRRLDDDTAMDAKTPIRLTGHEHERFAAVGSWFTGEGVANQIGTNVAQMVAEKEGEISETATSWRGQRRFMQEGTARTQAEWDALGQQIQQIQRENPDIALISIEYIGDGSAYRLYANREPVEDQVLLEYEDELDFNQPIELIPLGTFQSIDMTMKRPDLPGAPITSLNMLEEQPVNAKIHYMRASNARVHRYRAQNREHETGR